MSKQVEYLEIHFVKVNQKGTEETRCYPLPIDVDFEKHYTCFLETLIKDRIFLQNTHLEDIASRYANAIKDKLESRVAWRQDNSEFASTSKI
jgi:hypothetical protein